MKLKLIFFLFAALLSASVSASENPKADNNATVVVGNARFTVLTPQLIRMEWSEDGIFEDRATLTFVNRNLPVPAFTQKVSGKKLVIKTDKLTLTYIADGGAFTHDNLKVEFMVGAKKVCWHYGDEDKANLMGTTRTLDLCDGWKLGREPMEKGILSRDGWSVIDDSKNHVFVPVESHWKNWVACRTDVNRQDLYMFAYGHEYRKALLDYTSVAGQIPLPPRYAFGYWWSRYWQYSDIEFKDLVNKIKSFDIPIDVLIVDMDWHETWSLRRKDAEKDEYDQRIGWTGYTWKEQLFPSPKNFLSWCHDQKLKTALNLHPASGIQPYEKPYNDFIKHYGWKDEGKSVPFHIDEQKWADSYFATVLGPMEKDGVDFWWLDWQQWMTSKFTKDLSNTFWLNHVFNSHMAEKDNNRPFIYHRWGGLGSHRYQVGFSGDTFSTWETLSFLPYFTATASNVGYGYWGHDIGGHMYHKIKNATEPELYLRWLQYGVFTPIFKTHCTKNAKIERRIWMFPELMFFMRDAIRLRYTLAPYIYTAARQTFDSGVSMCRPMYYDYPEAEEAYTFKEQHMFGDDMIVTAVAQPVNKFGLASRTIWLPEGEWYDTVSGELLEGNKVYTREYTVFENPMFVRSGAIVPMNPSDVKNLQDTPSRKVFTFYPGKKTSSTILYEDDGTSKNYRENFALTNVTKSQEDNLVKITIGAAQGNFEGLLPERKFELRLEGVYPPKSVSINGKKLEYSREMAEGTWTYDAMSLSTVIYTQSYPTKEDLKVYVELENGNNARLLGKKGIFRRIIELTPEFKLVYARDYDPYTMLPEAFLNVTATPSYIFERPLLLDEWLNRYDKYLPELVNGLKALKKDGVPCVNTAFIDKVDKQIN